MYTDLMKTKMMKTRSLSCRSWTPFKRCWQKYKTS